MNTWKPVVLCVAILLAACSDVPTDAVADRLAASTDARRYISFDAAPGDAPSEYHQSIELDVSADAGFIPAEGRAYGQAVVNYTSTNASAEVTLVVTNQEGTTVGTNKGSAVRSHVFPRSLGVTATTTVLVRGACGHAAQATAEGTAFNSFISSNQSILTWGRTGDSDWADALQPACAPPPPPPAPSAFCPNTSAINYGAYAECEFAPTGEYGGWSGYQPEPSPSPGGQTMPLPYRVCDTWHPYSITYDVYGVAVVTYGQPETRCYYSF